MPLYEYKCEACGEVMEKLQSRSDSPAPDTCPHCGAKGTLARIVSNTSFQLKGSGWYVTDYGGGKGSASTGGAASASASEASGSATTSESATSSESSSATSSEGSGGGSGSSDVA